MADCKLSFRARALDAAKPLPVYRRGELPDLNACVSISRAVPQMPTGMEKEEELVCFKYSGVTVSISSIAQRHSRRLLRTVRSERVQARDAVYVPFTFIVRCQRIACDDFERFFLCDVNFFTLFS